MAKRRRYFNFWRKYGGRGSFPRMWEKKKRSATSMVAPRGQQKPQKKRPKMTVSAVTTSATPANPQIIFREAMNVRNPTSGLLLRSHRQSIEYARGNATQKKNRVQKSAKNNACP
jgi:hypothetical protein